MQLVVGTQNRDKGREIFARLGHLPLTLRGMWEWPDAGPVEETGLTLHENALLKAEAAADFTGLWAVADDTGLEVLALGGAPGVYSARYSGDDATYATNRQKLLSELAEVDSSRRGARFRTVIALARPGLPSETMDGVVEGSITTSEQGEHGFGYDSLFYVPGMARTFAQMTIDEKNKISHRGLALNRLVARLEEILREGAGCQCS